MRICMCIYIYLFRFDVSPLHTDEGHWSAGILCVFTIMCYLFCPYGVFSLEKGLRIDVEGGRRMSGSDGILCVCEKEKGSLERLCGKNHE